jgi:hypothetical protein
VARLAADVEVPAGLLDEPWTIGMPRPVPWPGGLVVKNGSRILAATSGGMPAPLSVIPSMT